MGEVIVMIEDYTQLSGLGNLVNRQCHYGVWGNFAQVRGHKGKIESLIWTAQF